ncbi:MAG TPA: zf-HC2 domain-containing protein [Candidatus Rubrimentiphilum sp.]|nr:zf-HC2 domain-containing protein [Candidatus Rubrimentiphilum sp.]
MNRHIDELAELYALGSLDDLERRQVDAHVRSCDECAARLGAAEKIVSELILVRDAPSAQLDRRVAASLQKPALNAPRYFYPLAAAMLVIAILPSTILGLKYRDAVAFQAQQAAAQHAMVNSHFVHAPFTPVTPDGPHAKVISARDGSWFYVVADTDKPLNVAVQTPGSLKMLGTLAVNGGEGSLFVTKPPGGPVVLLDGSLIIDRARR